MIIPQRYIDEGLVTRRPHPQDPDLCIYNYTPTVQYGRLWDEVTLQCRGLILRHETVVARPFGKFFSLEELENPPAGTPRGIFGKLDGSLGIAYVGPDAKWAIATRGSFESEQAVEGTKMLRDHAAQPMARNKPFLEGYTYLFEIIYPENKIVVDYQDQRKLVLLAVIETATGAELDIQPVADALGFEAAPVYTADDWKLLREQVGYQDDEGFVVLFPDGQRVKLKYEQYTRMHRALSELTPKRIWEYCSNAELHLEELIAVLPDEAYRQLAVLRDKLQQDHDDIVRQCAEDFRDDFATRKEAAAHFTQCRYPGVLFQMLDGKDPTALIWKLIKP